MSDYPPIDVTPLWALVNDDLIELLDLLPEDKLDWSPSPELWNTRGILLHVCLGRQFLTGGVADAGALTAEVLGGGQSKDGLKEQLRASWRKLEAFATDVGALDREYDMPLVSQQNGRASGHMIAFGLLEHDIHHRADILHYLRALGIAHEEPDSLARKLREGVS